MTVGAVAAAGGWVPLAAVHSRSLIVLPSLFLHVLVSKNVLAWYVLQL